MTAHYEEEAQAEQLKSWFSENWPALVAGLVLGLGAIFGWEGWKSYQLQQVAQASQQYEDLKKALMTGRSEDARKIGDALVAEFASTPYAAGASLALAADAVRTSEHDQALSRLQWVRDHAKDEALRQIATVRSARVLWQQDKTDEALKLLDASSADVAELAEELRGDIKLAKGDRAGARSAYEKALAAIPAEDVAARSQLQRKLDDLADVVQS